MRDRLRPYVLSLAILVATIALRAALDPWMGDVLPLGMTFGAVAAAAWVGGIGAASLVAIVGYVASAYLFLPPRGGLHFEVAGHLVGVLAYGLTAAAIIGFGEAFRRAQARAHDQRETFRITVRSIGDGVITTDVTGRITYLNAVAESLTGWKSADAVGLPLAEVFRILNETTRAPVDNPAFRALREGVVVGLANHTVLVRRDGSELPIDDSAAPIRDDRERVSGCVLVFRDASAQRMLEKERARQLVVARTLAAIVASSDDAIVGKTLDGVIQSWNAGAERVFGHRADEAIGRHISLVIPPERMAEEDQIIARLRAGERVEHFETERVRRDGERRLVSLTISPIRNEAGEVIGASKIARDVTEQRRAEERARLLLTEAAEANAKFRGLFEQSPLFAGVLALDGTVLEGNRLSWEGCGFAKDSIIGKPFWEGPWWAPAPALAARIRAGVMAAADGRPFRAEMPFFVADGAERTVDVSIQPIRDDAGRVIFLAPLGVDITVRKRAEAERERFAMLVENSRDFIGISDLDGMPLFVNRAGLAMIGLSDLEEARRTPIVEFLFPEDRVRVTEEFFPALLVQGHAEGEVRFRHFTSHAPRWMAYKVLRLDDAEGRPTGFATVSQDVTERRALTEELRTLAADLSDADRRKDEFLATLAHELRNPLAPIRNMLEVMKRAPDDAATLTHARDTIERQLRQMVRLVDDLLDLNRITHDRLELRPAAVDLATVIQQAIEASRPLVDAAGHVLRVALPDEPIRLHADADRLTQLFANLLNNACKYTPAGGAVAVTARREGPDVVVAVQDDGLGIPADKLESIFDMFTQVDRSLERSQGGLGIGLTLAKRLAEMHGGSISVRSAGEGQGSEFIVRLPILEGRAAEPAATAPAPPEPSRSQALRIVVVDDNTDAAVSLALLLELAGNRTFTAHDGVEALAVVARERPDVVLLDIGLPALGGHEVCRRIRAEPWGKDVLILALTGWGQEDDRRRSREAGFDGHLVKPVDYQALTALLEALVRERD